MNENDIHVMPVDDLKEHVFENCPCNPRIEVEGGNLIYVHNSWDGREYIEQVEEMLGIADE
jgi:hypothetical protein